MTASAPYDPWAEGAKSTHVAVTIELTSVEVSYRGEGPTDSDVLAATASLIETCGLEVLDAKLKWRRGPE